MSTAPTSALFTFRMIPMIAGMLAPRGIDAADLVREAGLPPEAVATEVTAPLVRILELLDLAAERLDAPLFGLDLAERVPAGSYGIPEFVVRSAPTVQRGLEAIAELSALINPMLEFRFAADANEGRLTFAIPTQRDAMGMHLNEYTIAFVVRQFRTVVPDLPLVRAWFAHQRKQHADAVAARLGCPVAYQAPDCGIAFDGAVVATAPRTADPVLFEFLMKQARAQLANLGTHDVVSQVVRVLEVRLPSGDVGAAAVARAMATTLRSLQRHLADAGTSFRDVLAHVRTRRRAELTRAGLSETEVARKLGFADARSMRRSLDESGDSGDR